MCVCAENKTQGIEYTRQKLYLSNFPVHLYNVKKRKKEERKKKREGKERKKKTLNSIKT